MNEIQAALSSWRKKKCGGGKWIPGKGHQTGCEVQCSAARRRATRFNTIGKTDAAELLKLYFLAMRGEWPAIGAL